MTLIFAVLALAQAPAWQATVDSLAKSGQFSGVVLVARNGVPWFERSYGMADREAARANTLETSFNLGSINKFFTQIAIRQLARGQHAEHRLVSSACVARLPQCRRRAESHNPP